MDVLKATQYIVEKHKGQMRMGGAEYSSHPIAVSELIKGKLLSEEMVLAALFHDLLEDTDATEEEILNLSNRNVLEAIILLTKRDGYEISEYISKISNNIIARNVKLADRIHNLQSAVVANDQFKKKYIKETEQYYLELSRGTLFEVEMLESYMMLKNTV